MTKTQRGFITSFIPILMLITVMNGDAAVTSVGEINVVGDDQGVVVANSTVALIVSMIIDRSQAEPGEEIRTIEIILPNEFIAESADIRWILRDGERQTVTAEFGGNSLRVVFATPISDFSNAVYHITFDCQTPSPVTQTVTFKARLRNLDDTPIGEFIKPGQADGKVNNDNFTLEVIPNEPPAAVQGLTVRRDAAGENDVEISWNESEDSDVIGYFIYRDNELLVNIDDRSSTAFRDIDVSPGLHAYEIEAYKTPLLRSERSRISRITVRPDTAAPQSPERLALVSAGNAIKVTWARSPSLDVTRYRVSFGSSVNKLSPLINGEILADPNKVEYEVSDNRMLGIGIFFYAVIAIDEAGNASPPKVEQHRILDSPAPNPFLPLSDNAAFNRIVFPARAIEGAEGEFFVLIFDIDGAMVKELRGGPDDNELEWDGKDEGGEVVESGVYIYQMQLGDSFKTGTIIVAK
ncbi:MAG: hypothetical protein OXT74_02260 [Candidatus Poribacteria bacterium]|nr:hypothetical protein [Candidatus Poribacteria bacterium]